MSNIAIALATILATLNPTFDHESGKFVNGILDKVRAEILRPARTAKDTPLP